MELGQTIDDCELEWCVDIRREKSLKQKSRVGNSLSLCKGLPGPVNPPIITKRRQPTESYALLLSAIAPIASRMESIGRSEISDAFILPK